MFELRESRSPDPIAVLSAAEYAELQDHVEGLAPDGGLLYVDAAMLESLPLGALPRAVRAVLDSLLTTREALEISVEVTDRERQADPEQVTSPVEVPAGHEVDVAGGQLRCLVCGETRFRERRAQLHSAVATFFDVEWLGPTATCCVCARCGYIHWFAR